MWTAFIVAVICAEAYYWLVYFPRAWRDGSNREINLIRTYIKSEWK